MEGAIFNCDAWISQNSKSKCGHGPCRPRRMVLRRLGRHRLPRAKAVAAFTRPPISLNSSTRSKSIHRSTSRCGPSIAGNGSNSSPPIPDSCSPRSCGRDSRTKQDAGAEDERAVRAGFDVLRDAGKLGAVLLQFPFSFHRTEENIAYLGKLLKQFSDYPLVVEVRHATWNDKAFYAMLHERGVGFCNIDQPVIGRSMKPTERATAPRRLRPPARPPLRHLVQRRSRHAALGALQLPLHRAGTRALGRAHPACRRRRRLHLRHHQQSFRRKSHRERAAAHPPAHPAQK